VPRATLNGVTLAESDHTEVVEGNHYFPPGSVKKELFQASDTTTHCPWKGDASYLGVEVGGASSRTPPGTTPSRKTPQKTSKTTSPSTETRST
jgi:uncharacterized protein (DUF427 family)